jgi:hypothetical protein
LPVAHVPAIVVAAAEPEPAGAAGDETTGPELTADAEPTADAELTAAADAGALGD